MVEFVITFIVVMIARAARAIYLVHSRYKALRVLHKPTRFELDKIIRPDIEKALNRNMVE